MGPPKRSAHPSVQPCSNPLKSVRQAPILAGVNSTTRIQRFLGRRTTLKAVTSGFAVALAFAAFAVPAMASSDPTAAQYCDGLDSTTTTTACSDVAGSTANGSTASGARSAAGGLNGQVSSLPFTGWDLISLTAVGFGLLCGGVALSRLSRARQEPPA